MYIFLAFYYGLTKHFTLILPRWLTGCKKKQVTYILMRDAVFMREHLMRHHLHERTPHETPPSWETVLVRPPSLETALMRDSPH